MIVAEQLTIDFDAPPDLEQELQRRWAENERRYKERWNDEARCILWLCDGFEDRDWWNSLPNYKRHSFLQIYLYERETADWRASRRLRSPREVFAGMEEQYQDRKRLAESWADLIRQAFINGKPCPIRPEPAFKWVLTWAFELAQVPQACVPVTESESEVER